MDLSSNSTDPERARSYRNLNNARQNAFKKSGYDSHETRTRLQDLFRARFGSDPHPWQLDVTEAILLGLDCIVIAGTGAGKTIPFMMPLLLEATRKSIIISPLKVLQEDQQLLCLRSCLRDWNLGLQQMNHQG